jgi:hypothetical protein
MACPAGIASHGPTTLAQTAVHNHRARRVCPIILIHACVGLGIAECDEHAQALEMPLTTHTVGPVSPPHTSHIRLGMCAFDMGMQLASVRLSSDRTGGQPSNSLHVASATPVCSGLTVSLVRRQTRECHTHQVLSAPLQRSGAHGVVAGSMYFSLARHGTLCALARAPSVRCRNPSMY